MNTKHVKTMTTLLMALVMMTLYSCRKDSGIEDNTVAFSQATSEETYNDVQNIADEAAQTGSVSYKSDEANALSGCAVVTRDTVSVPRLTTIDFGSGCVGVDGRTRSGKIIVSHTGPYRDPGTVIQIAFDNYYVEGNQVLGSKTIENMGVNSDGHTYFQVSVNGSIVLANGAGTIQWTSERVREWIAGEATPNRDDDQYSVTGTANGTAANGDVFNATITTPLVRNLAPGCRRHFVSGVVLLQRSNRPDRSVDFGNGTCDDVAVVTVNGNSHTITLH
ncbi:MAG: hypothetical protein IPH78_14240 [Bacteroidetes bacterium]|nr:hypothetical protein [Bacteroidota bacterium]